MIDAVAHCAVAILTMPSIEGSASATAAGVMDSKLFYVSARLLKRKNSASVLKYSVHS